MTLLVGVGTSQSKNSEKAGKEATLQALEKLKGLSPTIVIVFGSPRFNHAKLLNGIESITKKAPMVGGTTAGEASNYGFNQDSVVVMIIHSPKIKFVTGIGSKISQGEQQAGIALVNDITKRSKSARDAKALVMFNDALAGDGLEILKGIQSKLGKDFEIVGGALGDGDNFEKTHQYYNGKVYSDSVVGFMIFGKGFSTFTSVGSGWKSIGNRFACTGAKGNVVSSFNNRPALDVYEEYLGPTISKKLPAIAVEYPFGMLDEKVKVEGKDYFQIRAPLGINRKKKTIIMAAAIPIGKEVTLTIASRQNVIDNVSTNAQNLKNDLNGIKPDFLMMFSCVACRMVLGMRIKEEIQAVKDILGKDVPIIGFYTYGEIGPIDKKVKALKQTKWHNETVVLWALASKKKV